MSGKGPDYSNSLKRLDFGSHSGFETMHVNVSLKITFNQFTVLPLLRKVLVVSIKSLFLRV